MSNLIRHYRQLVGIAASWAKKTLPGWTDDMHRDLLARHGAVAIDGRISASSLTLPQLDAVLEDYERRGWQRQRNHFAGAGNKPQPVPARIGHLVRLWGRLGQAGKVERATRPALLAFCARQTRREIADLDSLSRSECQAITEALKAWLAR